MIDPERLQHILEDHRVAIRRSDIWRNAEKLAKAANLKDEEVLSSNQLQGLMRILYANPLDKPASRLGSLIKHIEGQKNKENEEGKGWRTKVNDDDLGGALIKHLSGVLKTLAENLKGDVLATLEKGPLNLPEDYGSEEDITHIQMQLVEEYITHLVEYCRMLRTVKLQEVNDEQ